MSGFITTVHLPILVGVVLLAATQWWDVPSLNGIQRVLDRRTSRLDVDVTPGFQWSQIVPSEDLVYHDCFGDFSCARLQVPMDWNSTSSSDKVHIAVIRLPAAVPVTDKRYGGPIFLNPGGPGVSGVDYVLKTGKAIQNITSAIDGSRIGQLLSSDPNAKYFDIVSFDPRGINNTTPFHTCFDSSLGQLIWSMSEERTVLGTPENDFDVTWASHQAVAENCLYDPVKNPKGSKIGHFTSTTSVARDLIEILEKHGKWRAKQGGSVWRKGEELLQYWGFSYGSVLGATAAAMQPHRVHRVVLDGVVDAEYHYAVDFPSDWPGAIQNNKIFDRFFELCHAAGPDACPMATGSSAADISRLLTAIEQDIIANGPVVVPATASTPSSTITLSDVKVLIYLSSYNPLTGFPAIAHALAPLAQRDGTVFAAMKRAGSPLDPRQLGSLLQPIDVNDPSTAPPAWTHFLGIAQAYQCSDARWPSTKPAFRAIWAEFKRHNPFSGDSWATFFIRCAVWPGQPSWSFARDRPIASNATQHPILFVGNEVDSVTPVRNARKMAAAFKGSGVLEVAGEGHCSVGIGSVCAGKAIREYFQTGRLPDASRSCLPHRRAFLGDRAPGVDPVPGVDAGGDRVIYEALMDIMATV